MRRLFFLLVVLSGLICGLEGASAQSQSRFEEIDLAARPQLEPPTEDVLDPMDPRNEVNDAGDQNDDLSSDRDSDLDLENEEPERLTDERIRKNWPKHTIREIDLSLDEVGRVPEDRSELLDDYGRVGPVGESIKVFAWEAPNIRYQPLFFEDVVLERYGQTQPAYRQGIRSAILFGVQYAGLGLQLLETNPKSCDHPLGFCRPGSCVPQTTQRHFFGPLSLRQ